MNKLSFALIALNAVALLTLQQTDLTSGFLEEMVVQEPLTALLLALISLLILSLNLIGLFKRKPYPFPWIKCGLTNALLGGLSAAVLSERMALDLGQVTEVVRLQNPTRNQSTFNSLMMGGAPGLVLTSLPLIYMYLPV